MIEISTKLDSLLYIYREVVKRSLVKTPILDIPHVLLTRSEKQNIHRWSMPIAILRRYQYPVPSQCLLISIKSSHA